MTLVTYKLILVYLHFTKGIFCIPVNKRTPGPWRRRPPPQQWWGNTEESARPCAWSLARCRLLPECSVRTAVHIKVFFFLIKKKLNPICDVTQNGLVGYIFSKCERWWDEQGVGAAKAQTLAEDALVAGVVPDQVRSAAMTKSSSEQRTVFQLSLIWRRKIKSGNLLPLWHVNICGHVVGSNVPKVVVAHGDVQTGVQSIEKSEDEFSRRQVRKQLL